MSDTILRQWAMLRNIPHAPRRITTSVLRDRLIEEGYRVDIRTVQRDLGKLSLLFPLISDGRSRPYAWSWMRRDSSLPWNSC